MSNDIVKYEITEKDFRYKDKDVVAGVKIAEGDFAGVEFHFGELNVNEDEENKTCTMTFNYDIISEHKDLEGNQEFETIIGKILNDILYQSLKLAEERYNNESGTKDT